MLIGRALKAGEKPIVVGFVGFHQLFHNTFNIITCPLLDHFSFDVVEPGDGRIPDFLFFSVFDSPHLNPRYAKCVKIFTCEENIRIPWRECDYALTGDHLRNEPRHLRFPIYARFLYHLKQLTGRTIVKPEDFDARAVLDKKIRFCNFVYSNGQAQERLKFVEMLSKYKQVDCGGRVKNNLGYRVGDKLKFLESYKFTIAFENSSYPGYISEKLVEPMVSNSLPIYWGCKGVGADFNTSSFIVANERKLEEAAEHVIHLDQNDKAYVEMMSKPWWRGNKPNMYCKDGYTLEFMRKIFSNRD
jgi:hypothetical protein